VDIKKCDFCRKEIKDFKNYVTVRFAFKHTELCEKCGQPILKFLKKNKIVDTNNELIKES
jgi:hypothetical protein